MKTFHQMFMISKSDFEKFQKLKKNENKNNNISDVSESQVNHIQASDGAKVLISGNSQARDNIQTPKDESNNINNTPNLIENQHKSNASRYHVLTSGYDSSQPKIFVNPGTTSSENNGDRYNPHNRTDYINNSNRETKRDEDDLRRDGDNSESESNYPDNSRRDNSRDDPEESDLTLNQLFQNRLKQLQIIPDNSTLQQDVDLEMPLQNNGSSNEDVEMESQENQYPIMLSSSTSRQPANSSHQPSILYSQSPGLSNSSIMPVSSRNIAVSSHASIPPSNISTSVLPFPPTAVEGEFRYANPTVTFPPDTPPLSPNISASALTPLPPPISSASLVLPLPAPADSSPALPPLPAPIIFPPAIPPLAAPQNSTRAVAIPSLAPPQNSTRAVAIPPLAPPQNSTRAVAIPPLPPSQNSTRAVAISHLPTPIRNQTRSVVSTRPRNYERRPLRSSNILARARERVLDQYRPERYQNQHRRNLANESTLRLGRRAPIEYKTKPALKYISTKSKKNKRKTPSQTIQEQEEESTIPFKSSLVSYKKVDKDSEEQNGDEFGGSYSKW